MSALPLGLGPFGKRERDQDESDGEGAPEYKARKVDSSPALPEKGNAGDLEQDEHGEGDDDIEGEEDVTKYDENNEPLPSCAAYDGNFGRINEAVCSVPRQVIDIIDEHGYYPERVCEWRANAEAVAQIPQPRRIRIGTLGATGMGLFFLSTLHSKLANPEQARAHLRTPSRVFLGWSRRYVSLRICYIRLWLTQFR